MKSFSLGRKPVANIKHDVQGGTERHGTWLKS